MSMRFVRRYGYRNFGKRASVVVPLKWTRGDEAWIIKETNMTDFPICDLTTPRNPDLGIQTPFANAAAGWAHYASFYNKYQVKAATVTITANLKHVPLDTGEDGGEKRCYVFGAFVENMPSATAEVIPASASWMSMAARGTCRYLQDTPGHQWCRMKVHFNRRNVAGAEFRDEWTNTNVDPQTKCRLHLWMATRDMSPIQEGVAAPPSVDFVVKVKYYCAFQGAVGPEVGSLAQPEKLY